MTVDLTPEQKRSSHYPTFMIMPSSQHIPNENNHNNTNSDEEESVNNEESVQQRSAPPRKRSRSSDSDLNEGHNHHNSSSFLIKDILKEAANQSINQSIQSQTNQFHQQLQSPNSSTPLSNNNPLLTAPYPQDLSLRSAALLSAHHHHQSLTHPFGLFGGPPPLGRIDPSLVGRLGPSSDAEDHDLDGDDVDDDMCSSDGDEDRNCSDSAKSNSSSESFITFDLIYILMI